MQKGGDMGRSRTRISGAAMGGREGGRRCPGWHRSRGKIGLK